jgi:hypothetical protein
VKQILSPEGRRRLRGSWILLAASAVTTIAFVGGTHWYLEKERRDATGGARRLQEASSRLENIRRERDTLEQSIEVFRVLIARGLMQPERRLELVELVNRLRARHHIVSVDYEIAPQRPLALPGGRSFPAIDILASRVSLRIRALHEGDLVAFIEALGETSQGFHPVDRCQLRRQEVPSADALQPRVEAECTLEWITVREKRVA